MRLASHLKRSPLGVYYFRLIVPKSLRPLVHGQREIKRSLHTRDPATARRLAYMLWAQTELRLREARRAMSGYDPTKFDPNDPSTWPSAAGDARGWIAKIGGVTIEADPSKPGDSESAIAAIRQLSGRGDGGSGESELGNIGVIDQFYTPPPSPPPPTAYKSVHFSEAKDDYLKIVTKEAEKGDLAAGTLIEMTGAFTRFLDWSSSPHDPQLSQIDRPMMERYMKHLLLDEPNKNTRSKGLSPGTVKKQISFLNGLFTHCKSSFPKGHDLPTENLSPYRRGTKHKTEHKARYRPFDSSELKIIFAPENLGKVRKPHEFWCPLLGLYLGARLEEICQLRLKDIEQRGDLTVLHIVSEPDDAGNGGPHRHKGPMTKAQYLSAHEIITGQSAGSVEEIKGLLPTRAGTSLKNEYSVRELPLHDDLIRLGFLDYLEDVRVVAPDGRVFPYLHYSPVHGYGDVPSESFGRYLDKVGITHSKKTFHSFRSTLNNLLQKKPYSMSEELCRIFMGQEVQSINKRHYSDDLNAEDLHDLVFSRFTFKEVMQRADELRYRKGRFSEILASELTRRERDNKRSAMQRLRKQALNN